LRQKTIGLTTGWRTTQGLPVVSRPHVQVCALDMEFGSRTLKSLTTRGLTNALQRVPTMVVRGRSVPGRLAVGTVER